MQRTSGSKKRAGRAAATREEILASAARLFLEEGYSQTSLERIAEEAGVTKPTVYSHFASKQRLFDAVVETNSARRASRLREVFKASGDVRRDLECFGDLFMECVLSREARKWDRLAAAESLTHPEVSHAFYQAGPARVLKGLTDYLRSQVEAGRLKIEHPQLAAEQLIGMLLGLDLLRTQIGKRPPSSSSRRQRCRQSVSVFLSAYGSKA